MSGFKGFKREASELAEELQSYCKDQFESWVSEMMTAIDDPKQPLRYSLGCHCCNIMYVGLQYYFKGYLSFKGGGLQYIMYIYIHNYMYTCVCDKPLACQKQNDIILIFLPKTKREEQLLILAR